MSRVFAYCRVSTATQLNENQLMEIKQAGFDVRPARIVEECISGSAPASERAGFCRLLDRMENGDVLVVTRLDRLGRNAMDVRHTVEGLAEAGIRVHCLALGGVDLTSSAGRMTMQVIGAVAEFERDLLIERTQAGIMRARASGRHPGRPFSQTPEQKKQILASLATGATVSSVARAFSTTRQTVMRIRDAAARADCDILPSDEQDKS